MRDRKATLFRVVESFACKDVSKLWPTAGWFQMVDCLECRSSDVLHCWTE